ncbi:MAG TPA: integrase arm-type DNA-binding domain-containing protein [Hyphomicrobiaceae bacterium]|nr:integrase arm-type DNA-binding domain-containing protein [Hyphomicrobiaceae bacterium]
MAGRQLSKLTALEVKRLTKPGRHSDGGGLYLVIDTAKNDGDTPSKRWVFMYRRKSDGRRSEMGLGGLVNVSLARARELAQEARATIAGGHDPIRARDASKASVQTIPTFLEAANAYIAAKEPGWRNEKHRYQWRQTVDTYCAAIASRPVNEITTDDVLAVLQPIWRSKAETAARVRGRIEHVLDAAAAAGHRLGENPARYRGHLRHLLPDRIKLQRGHHPALPWKELPAFVTELRTRESVTALALEFCILTASRTTEVLQAQWTEFDLDAAVWTIPPQRMKAGMEHRVPLSPRAMEILSTLGASKIGAFVFPSNRANKPLSAMTMLMLLRRMGHPNITVHGFRSTFRDWCDDATNYPREIAEAAIAHRVGSDVERAYARGDRLEKRRALMEAWANYCNQKPGNVVPMSRPA